MLLFLELPVDLAILTAIVLPIIAVCFFIFAIPWLRNGSSSKIRRYLSYAITPPGSSDERSEMKDENSAISSSDKNKLYFYYLGIALFLVSFIIAEFYQVMIDVALPVSQSNTGDSRIVTSIIFPSLFNAGWVGSLPWFGVIGYHGTWDWIFFTAGITDNPGFLSAIVTTLIMFSAGVGCVYLAPLAIRSIRQSFIPAMFLFMTGMAIFTKATIGYFAGALRLLFSTIEFPYTSIIVTGSMIPNYSGVITGCIMLSLTLFAFFVVLGRRLWKVYYEDIRSRNWFTVYIALSFWIGLLITVVVV